MAIRLRCILSLCVRFANPVSQTEKPRDETERAADESPIEPAAQEQHCGGSGKRAGNDNPGAFHQEKTISRKGAKAQREDAKKLEEESLWPSTLMLALRLCVRLFFYFTLTGIETSKVRGG